MMALAGAAAIGVGFAGSAEAASFNFSYTSQNGNILAGMLEGELQADNDTVIVSSITMPTLNGGALPEIDSIDSASNFIVFSGMDPVVSFSGAVMDIYACYNNCSNSFGFGPPFIFASDPTYSLNFAFEPFNASNWQLTAKATESVPEPASMLGLLAVGAVAAGALKKKAAA
jgi:hypothetical protein